MPRAVLILGVLVAFGAAAEAAPKPLKGPQRSTPIAATPNGKTLLACNPSADSVTLFKVSGKKLKLLTRIPVGDEPVSVAIHPNGRIAYVANSADGTVTVLDVKKKRVLDTIDAGPEPAALVLTPNGSRLYVSNAVSGTVTVVDTKTLATVTKDFTNLGLTPSALAMTNDGDRDDADERLYVTIFQSRIRGGKSGIHEGQDDQREGCVVPMETRPESTPILLVALGPIGDTGFASNGRLAGGSGTTPAVASANPQTFTTVTGAFPNQLAGIALRPGSTRGFVVSTGASPNGPVRFDSNVQGLVSVFDAAGFQEIRTTQADPSVRRTAPLNLNQGVDLDTALVPRLFHSNPVAIAWRPDGTDAWVVVQNSDVVVRMTANELGHPTIGAPLASGPGQIVRVDLQATGLGLVPAKGPRGIAISKNGKFAWVLCASDRTVTTIDISKPTAPVIVASTESVPLAGTSGAEQVALVGGALFHSGRDPAGRLSSESWGGCAVCHPAGRSDGVTWMFDGGPRQTIALDGTSDDGGTPRQRILNWSATRDEVHDFELNARNVSGGRGLVEDDRLFFAFGGASGAAPAYATQTEQFHQFLGAAGTTNALASDATLPNVANSTAALVLRRDFATATLDDGRVFFIGGRIGTGLGGMVGAADLVLEFDPRTNTLTRKSSVGFTARHSLGAAAVKTMAGERIYAIGGFLTTTGLTLPTPLVDEYDPATDTWGPANALAAGVAEFGIAVSGGVHAGEPVELIHVVGGNTGTELVPSVVNANLVQRFQAAPGVGGTWGTFNPAGLTPRRLLGAAVVMRGTSSRLFAIGGIDAAGATVTTVEEYFAQNPAVGAVAQTPLPLALSQFGIAASLSTNQVYVAGGVDVAGTDQSQILEFTPAVNGAVAGPAGTPSGAWVARGALMAPRRGLQLTQPPGVTNLLPVKNTGRDARHDAISAWVRTSVRPATGVVSDNNVVTMGRAAFLADGVVTPGFSCNTCHGGPLWTRSTVDFPSPPSPEIGIGFGNERVIGAEIRQTQSQSANVLVDVGTFTAAAGTMNELRANPADVSQAVQALGASGFNIPSLLSVGETAPYFHNGRATTLEAVLDGSADGNGGARHHFVTDPVIRAQIVAFLRSIDADTSTFP